jgi:hypothetical protein
MERGLISSTAFADPTSEFFFGVIFILFLQIWYFIISSTFATWYLHSVSAIFYFWSNRITSRRYLFSFCDICSISVI